MKNLVLLFLQLQLLLIIPTLSQTLQKENSKTESFRLAFVNHYEFEEKRDGVEKLSKAYEILFNEGFRSSSSILYELNKQAEKKRTDLENKDFTALQKVEIKKSLVEINAQIEEIELQLKTNFEKRKQILVQPILDEMNKVLAEIASENNFVLLKLDDETFEFLLDFQPQINITKEVIPILNEYFKIGVKPQITIKLPQIKIARINTNLFSDKKLGIINFAEKIKISNELNKNGEVNQTFYMNIGKEISNFALEREFNLVIDSSKKIPTKLENLPSHEITKEFISYYNQKNQ